MEIIKETKYLLFVDVTDLTLAKQKKTKIISVRNKSSNEVIATIEWYGAWRQYCFMPERFEFSTVWNNTCLADVISVIDRLMQEKRGKYNQKANNGQ